MKGKSKSGRSTPKPKHLTGRRAAPKSNPGLTGRQLTSGIAGGFEFAKPVRKSGRGGR